MKSERLASRQIVLLGVGHTNGHVVRMWKMNPLPDTDLTCVSDRSIATYSGMLPAVLCGQLEEPRMEIDLVRLCSSVGARLIVEPVTGLNVESRELHFESRPPIPFDALSIGIGSVPTMGDVEVQGDSLLKIKPMQSFLDRLQAAVERIAERVRSRAGDQRLRVAVVGGGVAGVEILFCLPPFLTRATDLPHSLQLVTRGDQLVEGVSAGLRRRVRREIDRRGNELTLEATVVRVSDHEIQLEDGRRIAADLVIWATGAAPPPLLEQLGLPLSDNGFLATDITLRSTSGAPVFAVGDTGSIVDRRLPKSGVYAVRQGPLLWKNLRRQLEGRPLEPFRPQPSFMKLLNLGDGRAVGEWKGVSFGGRWTLRLKHAIDNRFMDKFDPEPMPVDEDQPMQCRGCGCKLGGDTLASALDDAGGAGVRDDAAPIGDDPAWLASTDFFSSPFDDAYLLGRVVALHSASDLIASGASVTQALANVVLPEGDPQAQQRTLGDLLQGARLEFDAMGAEVVGGHTIVGPRMEAGFTVIGRQQGEMLRKGALARGDQLLLTKPLGVGVLLAAHMRSECHADHYEALLKAMLTRQHTLVEVARKLGIRAATDVTGFGLAGHLLEMLEASDLAAELSLDSLPVLDGVEAAIRRGTASSLAPANRHVEPHVARQGPAAAAGHWRYELLFDPQTCGGLLLGVPADRVADFAAEASAVGVAAPVRIGAVMAGQAGPRLRVV